jgi:hypothetical protein
MGRSRPHRDGQRLLFPDRRRVSVATINRLSGSTSVEVLEIIVEETAVRLLKLCPKRISTASHLENCSRFKALIHFLLFNQVASNGHLR